ncbi:DUF4294 domain-containing protein [Cellulophaga omnivescoria]|uniref:DUF4294 domain-containing protein n=1 Tax=Cellulophaga omnivescoria TaxID=1888890 RepID=UPI000986FC94|nr:DUF4294 domain-containing protein [Cellulophaga omnivescoria]WBU88605.1 DUF4294 domain-containing protein [Cellulophaga omnivescoria]WKB80580.1 DUF4294 domain-containing protein [Cellulophaga lytica]
MKLIKSTSLIIALLFTLTSTAQIEVKKDSVDLELYKIEGDSVYDTSISLNEVYVFGPLKFASKEEKLRYYILRRKTLKVYPYAKMAAEKLVVLNDSLKKIKKKSKKRKYTRQVHKEIEDQFSERLKKLTRTEGQILIKLINRQTGDTAFGLVKELRNGWRAFWYNTSAKFFKISIKAEYHPESVHEDYLIEDILQRAFAKGRLKEQPTVLNYDYTTLTNKWITNKKE